MAFESSYLTLSIKDSSKEVSSVTFPFPLITGANMADRITERDAVIGAVEAVINGTIQNGGLVLHKRFNTTPPAGSGARRETKLLVSYEDADTLVVGAWAIPTFDITKVTMITGTDEVDMSVGAAAALKTALEANVASPAGNDVVIRGMRSVGRNL